MSKGIFSKDMDPRQQSSYFAFSDQERFTLTEILHVAIEGGGNENEDVLLKEEDLWIALTPDPIQLVRVMSKEGMTRKHLTSLTQNDWSILVGCVMDVHWAVR
ncbi:hypothetical protein NDU88_002733 [Pleurodeles waltl]|uniref:Uncharacterized protein n=1 Tax=Pleurodeles waltl TaxID=8319 RepID=A0AAV7UA41_PLEWA|nr:hypothetical protein NDU88_002733 [Pleurodeles waltl]